MIGSRCALASVRETRSRYESVRVSSVARWRAIRRGLPNYGLVGQGFLMQNPWSGADLKKRPALLYGQRLERCRIHDHCRRHSQGVPALSREDGLRPAAVSKSQ